MEVQNATSERSSHDEKAFEKLLKVMTCAVDRLKRGRSKRPPYILNWMTDFCQVTKGRELSDYLSPSLVIFMMI